MIDYFFKVSYKSQNYKVSQEYKNWKKIMIEKYGKNGKEIICPNDNTIIYKIHRDNDKRIICPGCNSVIYNCIFCNKMLTSIPYDCRTRANLRYKIKNEFKEEFDYIFTNNNIDNKTGGYFYLLLIISFIPFFSTFNLFFHIISFFDMKEEILSCKDFLVFLFIVAFTFIMALIYGIMHYIIYISFFILSIPFKSYPIKLYFVY